MSSLSIFADRGLLSCMCIGLVFLAATLASLTGHLADSVLDQYTTDDLFAVLPPDHQAGVTPPEELMWEEEGYQLYDHPPLEPNWSESRDVLPYRGNLATSIQAGPSYYPNPLYAQLSGSDTPAYPGWALRNELNTDNMPYPSGSQDTVKVYERKEVMESLSNLQTVFQEYHLKPFYRSYFTPAGGFVIPELRRHGRKFKFAITTIINREAKRKLEQSKSLMYAGFPVESYVFEMLQGSNLESLFRQASTTSRQASTTSRQASITSRQASTTCFRQPISTLIDHYQNLILFMHKIYEERLDQLEIPVVAQLPHQEKMLDWLFEEIFPPSFWSLPLPGTGIARRETSSAGHDFYYRSDGPIQAKLREYFAQVKYGLELLPATALSLLEEFQRRYRMDSFRNDLSKVHLLQTQSSTDVTERKVEKLVESLSKVGQIERTTGMDKSFIRDEHIVEMVDSAMKVFEEQRDRYSEESSQVQYIHPTLQIGIIQSEFLKRIHISHQIRILHSPDSSPIETMELSTTMKKLFKEVDLFHCYILYEFKQIGRAVPDPGVRRESLLKWLIQSAIKPSDGLPIHGLVPITNGGPPYDHLFQKDLSELFGPVQIKLIGIFSNIHMHDRKTKFEHERPFFVVTWYAHHFPDEIPDLITYLSTPKTKRRKQKQPHIST
ncbi:hypothetical protein PCANC_02421 [Puccinia coronata f. sp. avenae]|uniref:Uncharacterized protein n=1 Tax=Puccinia coronata f. sp. avenae TaxID=200324 RepID=A0A2N5W4T8_9BASI|nr:hypothetical protein PCANC_02421 [Puccinia coronata f. sp. avenae]